LLVVCWLLLRCCWLLVGWVVVGYACCWLLVGWTFVGRWLLFGCLIGLLVAVVALRCCCFGVCCLLLGWLFYVVGFGYVVGRSVGCIANGTFVCVTFGCGLDVGLLVGLLV